MNIAYNSALQSATAALSACGYRPSREGNHHYRVIQSLELTIEAGSKVIRDFDAFRKKRNVSSYDQEVREVKKLAHILRDEVAAWLTRAHPEFL